VDNLIISDVLVEFVMAAKRISALTKICLNNRCTGESSPDYSCGDPGTPPCRYTEFAQEEWCENCQRNKKAYEERRIIRKTKSQL
jgi:hypothetical protein